MLDSITLENFKAFQKLDNLQIKPITILCGTNSCGKSSILQSILLFKQTLESKTPNQNLLLNGRFVKLGSFEDIIHKKITENTLSFDFSFKIVPATYNAGRRGVPVSYIIQEIMGDQVSVNSKQGYEIDYSISLKPNPETNEKEDSYLKSLQIQRICFKMYKSDKKEESDKASVTINLLSDDLYDVQWSNLKSRLGRESKSQSGSTRSRIQFENIFPSGFRSENNNHKPDRTFIYIRHTIYDINYLLQNLFTSYHYLGPLRQSHQDGGGTYFGDDIIDIGNSGENAPFLYLKEKNKILNGHYFHNNLDSFSKSNSLTLGKAFDKWFSLMGIKEFGGTINNRIINLFLNANRYDNTRIDISQVGFGISQIFPIVLEGLRMEKGATLLLEQPEIHLHPNMQMQMADYFISLALSGKRVIIETHSDHIINRLVRRIVEDEKFNFKDLIGIYFISPSKKGSTYEEINIDEKRGITNWPKGFFNQTADEQMKIMQAGLKKRKNITPLQNSKNEHTA